LCDYPLDPFTVLEWQECRSFNQILYSEKKEKNLNNITHTDGSKSMFQQQHPLFSKLLQTGADQ